MRVKDAKGREFWLLTGTVFSRRLVAKMSPVHAQRFYYFSYTYRYPYRIAATVERERARDPRM